MNSQEERTMKKALITGITARMAAILPSFCLRKVMKCMGLLRRTSTSNTERIDHLIAANKITLHLGDRRIPAASSEWWL